MSNEVKGSIWAVCPDCPEQAHTKSFPVPISTIVEVDWKTHEIAFRVDADTRQLRHHVATLHPDKVKADAGVCT